MSGGSDNVADQPPAQLPAAPFMRLRRHLPGWSWFMAARFMAFLMITVAAGLAASDFAMAANSACNGRRPPCADIKGFAGDNFTITWNGGDNTSPERRHCAISNRANRGPSIDVTAVGSGPGGAFVLTGPGGTVPFIAEYRNPTGGSWVTLTPGSPSNFATLTEAQFNTCDSSGSSVGGQQFRIRVLGSDMERVAAGTYTGSVTLTVETPTGNGRDSETSGPITVISPPLLNFIGLKSDFNFGMWDSLGDETNSDTSICVWTNNRTSFSGLSSYQVTATTTNGAFEANSDTGTPLPFDIYWADRGGVSSTAGATQLFYGGIQVFDTTNTSQTCTGGDSASMVVLFNEDDLSVAAASSTPYQSTVLIEVSIPP